VKGKVTKDGQPVAGAAVAFGPTASEGKAASGMTDASGNYTLTTFENGDGALPGSYKVTITKFPGAAPAATGSSASAPSAADIDAAYKAAEKQGQSVLAPSAGPGGTDTPKNELDDKFANAETSGLTAEVKAGGANTFDFDVSAK
jgi:hypothetical protein